MGMIHAGIEGELKEMSQKQKHAAYFQRERDRDKAHKTYDAEMLAVLQRRDEGVRNAEVKYRRAIAEIEASK